MTKCLFAVLLAVAFLAGLLVSVGPAQAQDAKALYDKECAKCHGAAGAGDGPQGQKLKDKPTNWAAGGGGLKGMDDQKIFDSIKKGGKAIGKSAAMPAYPKLSDAEVQSLVAYVKTLQK